LGVTSGTQLGRLPQIGLGGLGAGRRRGPGAGRGSSGKEGDPHGSGGILHGGYAFLMSRLYLRIYKQIIDGRTVIYRP
jgi:hypothetical protein